MAISESKQAPVKRHSLGSGLLLAVLATPGAIIVLLRLFVFQPFSIPSQSMAPTFMPGDYVLVSKISYGYGRYSLPLVTDQLSGRIPSGWLPERGDVVVFRVPGKSTADYIKRVVGLPGDRVQMIGGVLNINGVAVPRQRLDENGFVDKASALRGTRYRETLPNGVDYMIVALPKGGYYNNTPVYNVPAGQYFVLGDNRDNSTDSRMLSQIGYIPLENIIGRAKMIFFSIDNRDGVRWDRMFQAVQ
jgi:signal peptidase I